MRCSFQMHLTSGDRDIEHSVASNQTELVLWAAMSGNLCTTNGLDCLCDCMIESKAVKCVQTAEDAEAILKIHPRLIARTKSRKRVLADCGKSDTLDTVRIPLHMKVDCCLVSEEELEDLIVHGEHFVDCEDSGESHMHLELKRLQRMAVPAPRSRPITRLDTAGWEPA